MTNAVCDDHTISGERGNVEAGYLCIIVVTDCAPRWLVVPTKLRTVLQRFATPILVEVSLKSAPPGAHFLILWL